MPRGGKRPGAGRKKGYKEKHTLAKEAAREVLRQLVTAEIEPMVEAQIKHAKGISYLVYRTKRGGKFTKVTAELAAELFKRAAKPSDEGGVIIEVWEKEPSVQAFTDLMNRAIDKPAETVNAAISVSVSVVEERLKAARDRLARTKRGNSHPHA
jgi:hypothetical protein